MVSGCCVPSPPPPSHCLSRFSHCLLFVCIPGLWSGQGGILSAMDPFPCPSILNCIGVPSLCFCSSLQRLLIWPSVGPPVCLPGSCSLLQDKLGSWQFPGKSFVYLSVNIYVKMWPQNACSMSVCVCALVLKSVKLVTPDYSGSGKIQTRGQWPFWGWIQSENLSAIFGKNTHVCWTCQRDILLPI